MASKKTTFAKAHEPRLKARKALIIPPDPTLPAGYNMRTTTNIRVEGNFSDPYLRRTIRFDRLNPAIPEGKMKRISRNIIREKAKRASSLPNIAYECVSVYGMDENGAKAKIRDTRATEAAKSLFEALDGPLSAYVAEAGGQFAPATLSDIVETDGSGKIDWIMIASSDKTAGKLMSKGILASDVRKGNRILLVLTSQLEGSPEAESALGALSMQLDVPIALDEREIGYAIDAIAA